MASGPDMYTSAGADSRVPPSLSVTATVTAYVPRTAYACVPSNPIANGLPAPETIAALVVPSPQRTSAVNGASSAAAGSVNVASIENGAASPSGRNAVSIVGAVGNGATFSTVIVRAAPLPASSCLSRIATIKP